MLIMNNGSNGGVNVWKTDELDKNLSLCIMYYFT